MTSEKVILFCSYRDSSGDAGVDENDVITARGKGKDELKYVHLCKSVSCIKYSIDFNTTAAFIPSICVS